MAMWLTFLIGMFSPSSMVTFPCPDKIPPFPFLPKGLNVSVVWASPDNRNGRPFLNFVTKKSSISLLCLYYFFLYYIFLSGIIQISI